jgi:hypothetical protein
MATRITHLTIGSKTRVVANPKGYSKGAKWASSPEDLEHENSSFDQRFTVEI